MPSPSNDQSAEILQYYDLIDHRIQQAEDLMQLTESFCLGLQPLLSTKKSRLIELAPVSTKAIRQNVNPVSAGEIRSDSTNPPLFSGSDVKINESPLILIILANSLSETIKPKDLLAELFSLYASPSRSSKKSKKKTNPSFAFLSGFLSVAAIRSEITGDSMEICKAALKQTQQIANAALIGSKPEILDEISAGIKAGKAPNQRHTALTMHTFAVRTAYRKLLEESEKVPKKGEVRRRAIKILAQLQYRYYDDKNTARWKEVFAASGLKKLEQERTGSKSNSGT